MRASGPILNLNVLVQADTIASELGGGGTSMLYKQKHESRMVFKGVGCRQYSVDSGTGMAGVLRAGGVEVPGARSEQEIRWRH